MKIKNQKDLLAGLMFLAFGLAFVIIAGTNYQMGTAVRMGPAYFPILLGGLLAVLGFIIFARSFFSNLPAEATTVRMSFSALDFVAGIAVFAILGYASKLLLKNGDYGMLAAAVILAALSFKFRPNTKPLILIIACCLVFAYLLKPLGLVLGSMLLIFVAALGGHEYKFREVAVIAVVLSIFSVIVFVYGLTLPFPIWPDFLY